MDDNGIVFYFQNYKKKHQRILKRLIDVDVLNYLNNRFKDSDSINESLYRIENNIEEKPLCQTCKKPVIFNKDKKCFQKFCSKKCSMQDSDVKEKIKRTCIKKYGHENPSQNKNVQDKREKTFIKNFGCKNPFQNKSIKEKIKKTNLQKYGFVHPMYNQNIKEKIKNTNLQKYGSENPAQSKSIKEKIKKTNLQKYGFTNAAKNSQVKQKQKQTNLQKYGVVSTAQNEGVKAKAKETFRKHYGVEHPLQNDDVKRKVVETNLQKFGTECALQNEDVKAKCRQTNKENYGVEHPLQCKEILNKVFLTKKAHNSFNTSKPEEEDYLILKDVFGADNVLRQYKSDVYPFACDFYIKSINLYIELNFHWTHGGHPFDENNPNDVFKLNHWKSKNTKYYQNAIRVWSVKDPSKLKAANEHKLNYKAFYTIEDFDSWIKSFIIDKHASKS